jgi:hypothetical protein
MTTENPETSTMDKRTKEYKAMMAASSEPADAKTDAVVAIAPATQKETPEQSRARAEAKIRQLRSNPELNGMDRDKYWAPPPPDGWDYQFKLKSVLGQDDNDRIRQNELNGWEPVPLSRHPELMPKGWKGETIEIGGLVLMERPMMFSQEARDEEKRLAREAVHMKEIQMREGRSGDLGPRQINRFSKSHSRIDVPNE